MKTKLNAPAVVETKEVAKVEVKEKKSPRTKPGLASNLAVLKALEAALVEVSKTQDGGAIKLMSDYVKTQHRRLRPWAKTTVEYQE